MGKRRIVLPTSTSVLTRRFHTSQSLVRIPETLVCAMEFIILHTPGEHLPSINDLRKVRQRGEEGY